MEKYMEYFPYSLTKLDSVEYEKWCCIGKNYTYKSHSLQVI